MAFAPLLFAAAAATGSTGLPDIALTASATVRDVKIDQNGRASAHVTVEPSAGQRVEVERNLPKGSTHYRNLKIDLTVEGRLADPRAGASTTSQPSQQGNTR